jgi:hypothetical protein
VLPIAASHPTQLYVSGTLSILALGALAVSYAAIAALARNRGSVVATVAALIGGLAAFCGAIINVFVGVNLAAAATAHVSRAAAAQFLVTTFNSGFGHLFVYFYFAGIPIAAVLMGVALWRSRSVPRWLAALFPVSVIIAQQLPSAGVVVISRHHPAQEPEPAVPRPDLPQGRQARPPQLLPRQATRRPRHPARRPGHDQAG